ncbi:winged helix-turn-helix domain-containing protein [Tannockella kyphosi]|uniref:winged helix-turn-helix domain-containing protein n=1 Tax=Tannockella kyphosi TaxID=2899121 RepID=UPI0037D9BA2B
MDPLIEEQFIPDRTILTVSFRETSIETSIETNTQKIFPNLNSNERKIISLIIDKPQITLDELEKLLSLSKNGVRYNVDRLKEKGVLKREGSTKNGVWLIRNENDEE